jgi:hypothetical protein
MCLGSAAETITFDGSGETFAFTITDDVDSITD